jgi:hypothetical protein
MGYEVIITPTDLVGKFPTALQGGLWVPPPPGGSSPGAADYPGTVTSGTALPVTLTFAALDAAPAAVSAMLVTWGGGDLFRSGPVGVFPASPPPLALIIAPGQVPGEVAITPQKLEQTVGGFSGTMLSVPSAVQVAFGLATVGTFIPQSIRIFSANATLNATRSVHGAPVSLGVVGTINARLFGLFTAGFSFTFSMSAFLGPSGDPAEPGRVLAATVAPPDPLLIIKGLVALPGVYIALQAAARWMASAVASMLESLVNQFVATQVASALAQLFGQKLTSTAVISAEEIVSDSSGIMLFVSLGDIFGPGVVPIQTKKARVPRIVGDDTTTALQALQAANLVMAVTAYEYSYNIDSPTVKSQTPSAGTPVDEGSSVYVVIEAPEKKGPPPP